MKRSIKKVVAIILVAMFMLTLIPATGFAASTNTVDRVPQVSVGYTFTNEDTAPRLRIEERTLGDFRTGDPAEYFEIQLTNAKWDPAMVAFIGDQNATDWTGWTENVSEMTFTPITNTSASVSFIATGAAKAIINIPMLTEITGEGEARVTVDARDSGLSSSTLTFAVSAVGRTITTIDRVNSFARTVTLGNIRIDETRIGALGDNAQKIRLKLPPRFTWEAYGDFEFTGGLSDSGPAYAISGRGTRTLEFWVNPESGRDQRGSIYLKNFRIRADRDASFGDVMVAVDGDMVTSQDFVIARYATYDVEVSVATVNEVVAGRWDSAHNKTAKITIEENIPGAMIAGREIVVLLPEWVKPVSDGGIRVTAVSGLVEVDDLERAARQNEFYFVVNENINNDVRSKYEFELVLSVEADAVPTDRTTRDINAVVSGAGVEQQEVLIATAIAPVAIEVAATDLKIGVQNQKAPDIVISENRRWMIDDGSYVAAYWTPSDNLLFVTLPGDTTFSKTPKVEVEEGNLELGQVTVSGGNQLVIPIRSSSTTPSTIRISDVEVTLDRTVPEGPFYATIGGSAVVKNYTPLATITSENVFNKNRVLRFHFANVVTPAPGEMRAITTFTIGDMTYTRVEAGVAVEYPMDVAPYIMDGRTMLPVRYVAYALGVDPGSILWDPASLTVTIFKGERIIQLVIHNRNMVVNGVNITMDVAPVTVEGRTMLPIRWVAQAFGAQVDWDAVTQTVTVTQ